MYSNGWVMPETTALIGLFSLGWFLAGLLIAQSLAKSVGGSRKPEKTRERGGLGPKPSARGDRVEIYVGNLSYDIGEKDLSACFESYGRVLSVRLIENKFSGKSKGFGFVEMDGREGAMAAIKALSGKEFKGRKLVVNEARSRPRS